MGPLLAISELYVRYEAPPHKPLHALRGASLRVFPGQVVGLLGESGSGKSTIARASMRLLPAHAEVTGRIEFRDRDLIALRESEMQPLRGAQIAMIWQQPGQCLSPVMKIGEQVAQVLGAHRDWPSKRRRVEAERLLDSVQLPASRYFDTYPHQLSGGQLQRVAIAQVLACQPALIIADEPTASLDFEIGQNILQLLQACVAAQGSSLLLITHNPKILVGFAHRVAVMYAGRVIEEGPLHQVFYAPSHPYTKALLECVPPAPGTTKLAPWMDFPFIPGQMPDPTHPATGCSFAPRCAERLNICDQHVPDAFESKPDAHAECFLHAH
jgi:oligopeptide/dipeptide ABC transporter ATP-binding protein